MLTRSRFFLLFALLLIPFAAFAQDVRWASEVEMRPRTPKAGEKVSFLLTVKATGRHAARDFAVVGSIDGKRLFRQEIAQLEPRQSRRLRFTWTAAGGKHEAFFQIVAQRRARISAPKPLRYSFSIQAAAPAQMAPAQAAPKAGALARRVSPSKPSVATTISPQHMTATALQQPTCEGAPLPDLMINNIQIYGPGRHGEEHEVSVNVVNKGQCDSGPFAIHVKMRVQAQGVDKMVEIGNKGVGSLEPCRSAGCAEASHSESFSFTPQYNHALYSITVEVDSTDSVNEFNEKNNEINRDLRIDNY